MQKDMTITITSKHTYEGDPEPEITVSKAKGSLEWREKGYTLTFDEDFGEGMKSHTVLTSENKCRISILRTGDVSSELKFRQGKREKFAYTSPYGSMNIVTFTKKLFDGMSAKGGKIEICYTMNFNGTVTSEKDLCIEVK